MPLRQQAKLLRVLETGELERVGSSRTRRVDVRVVSATNADLGAEVAAGRFREDLLFRLNTIEIRLPPLRERREDIPLLAAQFLERYAARYRKALARLRARGAGSAARLRLARQRARARPRDGARGAPRRRRRDQGGRLSLTPAIAAAQLDQMTLEEVERVLIQKALARAGGNVATPRRRWA